MKITLEKTADREWVVRAEGSDASIGLVSRKQTGYLVTKHEGNELHSAFV
ncbi:MAG TPA: hypothetical protein VFH43_14440 [Candidatus Kapabacteria bacterium]|nr:hypothetical protein [Candidatus Kapabacteria bacterium]